MHRLDLRSDKQKRKDQRIEWLAMITASWLFCLFVAWAIVSNI